MTIDGVSLTVTGVDAESFLLNIVPHTIAETRIHTYGIGHKVHIEVDLMARYAERLLTFSAGSGAHKKNLDESFLAEHGFLK